MSATQHSSGSALARALLAAMSDKDFVTFKALMSPNVEYIILPASLGRPPTVGPEATAGGFERLCKFIPDFSVSINDIIEAEDKVWVYAHGAGKSIDGREYKSEYIGMLDLVRHEDGYLRIKRVREFVDSHFAATFFGGSA